MAEKIVVVGLGGIGSWLVQGLCPFLNYQGDKWELTLIDGDSYEPKNHNRQVFEGYGPKAEVQTAWIVKQFENIAVRPITKYISVKGDNDSLPIDSVIHSGSTVFSCVDNHKTRRVIARHCAKLDNSVLISGGNDYTDGNIQVFVRRDAENLTATIEKYHPEIAKPKDKAPQEMSCEEAAVSEPQLIFANMNVSVMMLNAFYTLGLGKFDFTKSEVYFDVLQNAMVPYERKK